MLCGVLIRLAGYIEKIGSTIPCLRGFIEDNFVEKGI